jgi:hypothetical protein
MVAPGRNRRWLRFMARWPKAASPWWLAWSLFVGHRGIRDRSFCDGDGSGECAREVRHDKVETVAVVQGCGVLSVEE